MITKIFFIDDWMGKSGLYAKIATQIARFNIGLESVSYVTQEEGFTLEKNFVKKLIESQSDVVLLTNDPLLINKEYLSTKNISDIYLYNFKEEKFKPIQSFTNEILKPEYSLSKMWIVGGFPDAENPD